MTFTQSQIENTELVMLHANNNFPIYEAMIAGFRKRFQGDVHCRGIGKIARDAKVVAKSLEGSALDLRSFSFKYFKILIEEEYEEFTNHNPSVNLQKGSA